MERTVEGPLASEAANRRCVLTIVGAVSPDPISVRIRGSERLVVVTLPVCPDSGASGKPTLKDDRFASMG